MTPLALICNQYPNSYNQGNN